MAQTASEAEAMTQEITKDWKIALTVDAAAIVCAGVLWEFGYISGMVMIFIILATAIVSALFTHGPMVDSEFD